MKNDLAAMDDSSDNPDTLLAIISFKTIWNRRWTPACVGRVPRLEAPAVQMHAKNLFVYILFICGLVFQMLAFAIHTKNYVSANCFL
ncbi:hypothetical protein NIES4073_75510 [Kalymmatonema gypsitolerans NIES-4073]|nr:hypothetical protein NIES4073_75510 [Scytonema sp. NIES-4073]